MGRELSQNRSQEHECWHVFHNACRSKRSYSVHCLQANALAKAGFRVVAPDLRGAVGGESDAPQEVEAYDIPKVLVKDMAGK